MQEQAEGVGQEAVVAQLGAEAVFGADQPRWLCSGEPVGRIVSDVAGTL